MVTMKEYQEASDNTVFVHKESRVTQPKSILRFKMNQVGDAYCRGCKYQRVEDLPHEHKLNLHGLLAEMLENFEISDMIISDEAKLRENHSPKKIRSRDNVGKFCHKCGLQKENTAIVEEGTKVMTVCLECRGN